MKLKDIINIHGRAWKTYMGAFLPCFFSALAYVAITRAGAVAQTVLAANYTYTVTIGEPMTVNIPHNTALIAAIIVLAVTILAYPLGIGLLRYYDGRLGGKGLNILHFYGSIKLFLRATLPCAVNSVCRMAMMLISLFLIGKGLTVQAAIICAFVLMAVWVGLFPLKYIIATRDDLPLRECFCAAKRAIFGNRLWLFRLLLTLAVCLLPWVLPLYGAVWQAAITLLRALLLPVILLSFAAAGQRITEQTIPTDNNSIFYRETAPADGGYAEEYNVRFEAENAELLDPLKILEAATLPEGLKRCEPLRSLLAELFEQCCDEAAYEDSYAGGKRAERGGECEAYDYNVRLLVRVSRESDSALYVTELTLKPTKRLIC